MYIFFSILGSFLLGSIPSAYILFRIKRHQDIRQMGSGNVGTMNVQALMGWRAALAVFICDFIKGVGAIYLCQFLNVDPYLGLALAVAGHIYSPWLGFKGGKGLATALGGVAVSGQWRVLLVFALIWLFFYMGIWRKKMDQANLAGALGIAVYSLAFDLQYGLILMAAIIAFKHWQVINQSKKDTEH